ncbi:MAG: sulfatase-like hydrolase/transferase [Gemmatimonadetes bacterium]|nr:sulfatase-like hydrolase/transferase [Gemmatimonadota bacterium]
MERPHIILITTDQQHHRMASYSGDPYVSTPNLDKLAAGGKRFELTYVSNPVCVPFRYALVSGHMPHTFDGLEHNSKGMASEHPRILDHIDTPLMGTLLRNCGYDTYAGGKLHVEGTQVFTKEKAEEFGFESITTDQRDELAERSADFLKNRESDRPFFLWASFINPHDICKVLDEDGKPTHPSDPGDNLPPLPDNHAPPQDEPKWMQGFRDGTLGDEETIEIGLNRRFGQRAIHWTEHEWRIYRAAYRFYMEDLDQQLGVILDALDDTGLRESTVVIFTSDHGDHDGEHGLTMKRSFYEASSHVPLTISWPGRVSPGQIDALVNNGIDLLPTLCDFAEGEIPDSLPGRSLKPLALGEQPNWREFVVAETVGGRMVRSARYKYSIFHYDGTSEEMLVDMVSDPTETKNFANDPEFIQILTDHRNRLSDWVQAHADTQGTTYLKALAS